MRKQHREKILEFIEDERKEKDSEILRQTDHIRELELQLNKKNELYAKQSVARGGAEGTNSIKLKWRRGKKAPHNIIIKMRNVFYGEMAAAVDGNTIYM